jgi:hypothetical protein
LIEKVEDLSLVIFLPLFFVFSGLRTNVGIFLEKQIIIISVIIILVAFISKFGSVTLASKYLGKSWKNSFSIGILMNARGLMELIVLSIGYDLGILTPGLFSMMVIMAFMTTLMTGPCLTIFNFIFARKESIIRKRFPSNILISFGRPEMGSTLLTIAHLLNGKSKLITSYTALHMTPSSELGYEEALAYEKESFTPIKKTAEELFIPLKTKYKASHEVVHEIIHLLKTNEFNFLLVGAARSLFTESIIGGKVKNIIEDCPCHVGICENRGLTKIQKIMIIIHSSSDKFLLYVTNKVIEHHHTSVFLTDLDDLSKSTPNFYDTIYDNPSLTNDNFKIQHNTDLSTEFVDQFDLIFMSFNCFKIFMDEKHTLLEKGPSLFIIKEHIYPKTD